MCTTDSFLRSPCGSAPRCPWCAPSFRSSSELLDPNIHAFHSGAPTRRLCAQNNEPMWTGTAALTAHLHSPRSQCTRCCWEGSLILLPVPPSSLLCVLSQVFTQQANPLSWSHFMDFTNSFDRICLCQTTVLVYSCAAYNPMSFTDCLHVKR